MELFETFMLSGAAAAVAVSILLAGVVCLDEMDSRRPPNRVVLWGSLSWIIVAVGLMGVISSVAK